MKKIGGEGRIQTRRGGGRGFILSVPIGKREKASAWHFMMTSKRRGKRKKAEKN